MWGATPLTGEEVGNTKRGGVECEGSEITSINYLLILFIKAEALIERRGPKNVFVKTSLEAWHAKKIDIRKGGTNKTTFEKH